MFKSKLKKKFWPFNFLLSLNQNQIKVGHCVRFIFASNELNITLNNIIEWLFTILR